MEIKRIGPPRADETPVYIGAMQGFSIASERPSWIRVDPSARPSQPPLLRVETTSQPRMDETPSFTYSSYRTNPRTESPLRFGEWLVRRELISPWGLFRALSHARSAGLRIGDAIVEQRLLERDQIELEALQHHTFIALYGGEPLATCPV